MWNSKHQFQSKFGFLLLELILSITLASILILSFYSMLQYTTTASILGEKYDEIILNGRYGIEYIKEEIKSADKIISTSKIKNFNIKYPKNFGFVIVQDMYDHRYSTDSSGEPKDRYRFISYYLNGNVIQRIACTQDSYPAADNLSGHNVLSENVLSINDSSVDFENKLIHLSLSLGNEKKELYKFKSTVYINCTTDY